jgi:hypothetical protein
VLDAVARRASIPDRTATGRSLSPDLDPVSGTEAALTAAAQLPRAARLLKRVAGVTEFTELLRRVVYEVRRDGELAPEVRSRVADALEGLRVDPDVNRVAHRLIAESDADALSELEGMLARAFGDKSSGNAEVAARVVHWIELTLPEVMRSDRQAAVGATRLMGGQLRRDVAEGFSGVGEQLAHQQEQMDLLLELAQGKREGGIPPAVDWAPDWPQKALRALAEVDGEAVERLRELVDGRGAAERLVEAVAEPPGWMRDGSDELWEAVARYAEYFGEWTAASTVWERLAPARQGEQDAMRLLRAAMDARVAGDADRHRRLLGQAHEAHPDHPRVQLELATSMPYEEQRERIAAIVPDTDETAALLKSHLALHAMLAKDLAEAERLVEQARRLAPDLVQVRTLTANVAIERNRRAISDNEPLDVELAEEARRQCLALREELVAMRRWDETHRLLLLAADSHARCRRTLRGLPRVRHERPHADPTPGPRVPSTHRKGPSMPNFSAVGARSSQQYAPGIGPFVRWARRVSNLRPLACTRRPWRLRCRSLLARSSSGPPLERACGRDWPCRIRGSFSPFSARPATRASRA